MVVARNSKAKCGEVSESNSEGNSSDGRSEKTSEVTITMLGSLTTGFLARLPFHPIDTIKSKMQIQVMKGGEQSVFVSAKPHAHSRAAQAAGRLPLVGR
jgi:hypothetical protein